MMCSEAYHIPSHVRAKLRPTKPTSGALVELLGKWSPVGKYVVVVLECLSAHFGATIGSQIGMEWGWERERDLNPNPNLITGIPDQVLSKANIPLGYSITCTNNFSFCINQFGLRFVFLVTKSIWTAMCYLVSYFPCPDLISSSATQGAGLAELHSSFEILRCFRSFASDSLCTWPFSLVRKKSVNADLLIYHTVVGGRGASGKATLREVFIFSWGVKNEGWWGRYTEYALSRQWEQPVVNGRFRGQVGLMSSHHDRKSKPLSSLESTCPLLSHICLHKDLLLPYIFLLWLWFHEDTVHVFINSVPLECLAQCFL